MQSNCVSADTEFFINVGDYDIVNQSVIVEVFIILWFCIGCCSVVCYPYEKPVFLLSLHFLFFSLIQLILLVSCAGYHSSIIMMLSKSRPLMTH